MDNYMELFLFKRIFYDMNKCKSYPQWEIFLKIEEISKKSSILMIFENTSNCTYCDAPNMSICNYDWYHGIASTAWSNVEYSISNYVYSTSYLVILHLLQYYVTLLFSLSASISFNQASSCFLWKHDFSKYSVFCKWFPFRFLRASHTVSPISMEITSKSACFFPTSTQNQPLHWVQYQLVARPQSLHLAFYLDICVGYHKVPVANNLFLLHKVFFQHSLLMTVSFLRMEWLLLKRGVRVDVFLTNY